MAVIAVKQLMKETGPSSTRRPCSRPPSFIRSFQKITLFMMETAKTFQLPQKRTAWARENYLWRCFWKALEMTTSISLISNHLQLEIERVSSQSRLCWHFVHFYLSNNYYDMELIGGDWGNRRWRPLLVSLLTG